MIEVDPPTLSGARFEEILGADGWRKFDANLIEAGHCLSGRTIWHVNSTMTGGGVAELLTSAVGYLRGASIATRWKVIGGHDEFFAVTKRIHHMLHGKRGDGGGLGEGERAVYDAVLDKEGAELTCEITAGDVVVLHDPQVAGLAPRLSERGAVVIWNCHVGADVSNTYTQQAWRFLASAVRVASMTVFSRKSYVWDNLDPTKVAVIPPCIDAFSPKNQDLAGVGAALSATGIIPSAHEGQATFTRTDGSAAAVIARAEMLEARPVPQDAMV
ncbi:MAG: glycosyltransferase, partial [Acidimicrobiales bacterium]